MFFPAMILNFIDAMEPHLYKKVINSKIMNKKYLDRNQEGFPVKF